MIVQASNSQPMQVAQMFGEILATLPNGCASLRQKDEERGAPAEVVMAPANEASAQFGAMFFGGALYAAFFGREPFVTTFECPWNLKIHISDGFDKQLLSLKKMCEAVVAGRCEHRVTALSVRGTIRVSDTDVYRIRTIPVFHARPLRQTIVYEPYNSANPATRHK